MSANCLPKEPRISVIVPLYNKGPYVHRTLDSILNQTCGQIEVVVVDDGSTDDGPDVIRDCGDPRVRLIRQANQGPGAARNRGLRECLAPYVAFLDADDLWLPEFLETAWNGLESEEGCPLFVSNHFVGTGPDTYLSSRLNGFVSAGRNRLPADVSAETMKGFVDLLPSGAIVARKDLISRYGGFLENRCTYGEDAFLWFQVLLNHPFYLCCEPLMRINLEASVLGQGRKAPYPVHPLVTDAAAILAACPAEYAGLVRRVLDYYALISLWRRMDCGDYESAGQILKTFPYSGEFRREFLKGRIKLWIMACIRFLVRRSGGRQSAW